MKKKEITKILHEKGYNNYKWINPKEIEVREWVRIKCRNCPNYGTAAHCPPHTPTTKTTKKFLNEYNKAILLHIPKKLENPKNHSKWTNKINQQLIEIENTLFLKNYYKAYTLFIGPCKQCKQCTANPKTCRHPKKARPTPEAMGIDVYQTIQKTNYPIKTLTNYNQTINQYTFILIE
ncbi:putative metal-binding protein [Methanonatronarchaeum thermophilum]|uniref:Putative metal-binding protein n=1 Tax=Methanonatronarchaeum thermophilum TaxID=1927129 RepID=A0A1Y3GAK1_9EURY|nr:DUF2284 domain-containing protein [Methanonatronarchaeum thermophilum]OUJ18448.1 putative metal-binding protein [Methanonatronarchaeum thermophilum]